MSCGYERAGSAIVHLQLYSNAGGDAVKHLPITIVEMAVRIGIISAHSAASLPAPARAGLQPARTKVLKISRLASRNSYGRHRKAAGHTQPRRYGYLRRCVIRQHNGRLFACGSMVLADLVRCGCSAFCTEQPHPAKMKRTALPSAQSANCISPNQIRLITLQNLRGERL